MADVYYIWRLAEAAQQIDLLAGFLATRHADGPVALRESAECARAGRAAVAAGRLREALDRIDDLRAHAARWAGHPHHPGEPGAFEQDARVWDYAKDMLRAQLPSQEAKVSAARGILSTIRHLRREICVRPEADAQARADALHLAGRAAMAVEIGHLGAARKELRRLRALAERCAGDEDR
ncbi:hypothetical protein DEJ51_23040 [Streptomyces venezuelae]|uniref:Uncharacterized protein n=1 Tax=Streptomyces venezuelae TaxID=54571 RepID=A0A5P2DVJ8_STRVZ|nr:hypothetical protein [Streptomyces venezuelae]QES56699.1 hypothetical protein DEJ51_23040 [Streptomyces venezuelae]